MTSVEVEGDEIILTVSEHEHEALSALLADYVDQIAVDDTFSLLFPNAYPDNPDAAAEFARYTRSSLVDRKTANAGIVTRDLAASTRIPLAFRMSLAPDAFDTWMPVLTDLRRILAERLGIQSEDDPIAEGPMGEIYAWLGELQWTLLEAFELVSFRDSPS